MSSKLSHIDENGKVSMVNVSHKKLTTRTAVASGKVVFPEEVFEQLSKDGFIGKKGSIIQTAVIAGIQAAKKTSELIPLCHQLNLSKIDIQIAPMDSHLKITATAVCNGQTGVEMEALTGVSIAALTIYDMCKALSHKIVITNIELEQKTGGKSDFAK
jgi:cyclic pyranopterin phosphate synthase